ncbi:MAG TPA: transglutaminase-like cysteine peptidase [Alphaproteobacteria bacterium]
MAALAALSLAAAGDAALARRKVAPPEPRTALHIPTDLFGAGGIAHPPAIDFAKWTETIARYERERRDARALCEAGDCALVRWREFLAALAGKDEMAQLRAVNDYLNRLPYRTDLENYGVEDYWATPREFFAKGGDCEDYAIAKYLSLRALGWTAERLRIVVVYDNARDLVHAALIAYRDGNAYLLDIEISQITDHRAVARYVPIFAISEAGWWSYRTLPPGEAAAAVVRAADTAAVAKPIVAAPAPKASEWRSLTMRHKPGHAPRAHARPGRRAAAHHAKLVHPWRSPHMKHEARRVVEVVKTAPRPAPGKPLVPSKPTVAVETEPATTPAPFVEPAPGERIEEMFLPAAQ